MANQSMKPVGIAAASEPVPPIRSASERASALSLVALREARASYFYEPAISSVKARATRDLLAALVDVAGDSDTGLIAGLMLTILEAQLRQEDPDFREVENAQARGEDAIDALYARVEEVAARGMGQFS